MLTSSHLSSVSGESRPGDFWCLGGTGGGGEGSKVNVARAAQAALGWQMRFRGLFTSAGFVPGETGRSRVSRERALRWRGRGRGHYWSPWHGGQRGMSPSYSSPLCWLCPRWQRKVQGDGEQVLALRSQLDSEQSLALRNQISLYNRLEAKQELCSQHSYLAGLHHLVLTPCMFISSSWSHRGNSRAMDWLGCWPQLSRELPLGKWEGGFKSDCWRRVPLKLGTHVHKGRPSWAPWVWDSARLLDLVWRHCPHGGGKTWGLAGAAGHPWDWGPVLRIGRSALGTTGSCVTPWPGRPLWGAWNYGP